MASSEQQPTPRLRYRSIQALSRGDPLVDSGLHIRESFLTGGFSSQSDRTIRVQTAMRRNLGSRRRTSRGSLVITACPVFCAQMTTCASAMSAVPLRASNAPTA